MGLLGGSIVCVKFSHLVDRHRKILIIGSILTSFVTIILFALTSVPVNALILSILIGIFGQIKNIPQQVLIQTSVSKEQLATVYTSIGTITTGTFGISSLLMGFLADYVGVRGAFIASGIALAIANLVAYRNRHLFIR